MARLLLHAAAKGWTNDPVFSPFYHETGYIVAASSPAVLKNLETREIRHHPDAFTPLTTAEAFRATMPEGVLTGPFKDWHGFYKRHGAGWVHARKALVAAFTEAARLGVRFLTGNPQGEVTKLLHSGSDVVGVETADGVKHHADRTILAAGAAATQLLDFQNQLRPTAWTLAHIPMTADEARLYKNLPVLFNIEKGFFMEPDEDRHEIKICDEHPGYCNWVEPSSSASDSPRQSTPFAKEQIPKSAARRMTDFLRDTMPHLADRPFTHARLCWCADTPNRAFLITYHPSYPSLLLAAGDSGHGFMHMPSIGGFIADSLEGVLDERLERSWRWRPDTAQGFWGDQTLGRFGAENKMLDVRETEMTGWTNIPPRKATIM